LERVDDAATSRERRGVPPSAR